MPRVRSVCPACKRESVEFRKCSACDRSGCERCMPDGRSAPCPSCRALKIRAPALGGAGKG